MQETKLGLTLNACSPTHPSDSEAKRKSGTLCVAMQMIEARRPRSMRATIEGADDE